MTGLVAWLDEHKDVEVRVGSDVMMLADVRWLPRVEPDEPLPLAEVLQPWWDRVHDGLTDGGLECALVCELANGLEEREYYRAPDWQRAATRAQIGRGSAAVAHHPLAASVLATVARRQARPSWLPALVDAHAAVLAALPAATTRRLRCAVARTPARRPAPGWVTATRAATRLPAVSWWPTSSSATTWRPSCWPVGGP